MDRTALLIGEEAKTALKGKRVAVFGLGGVGGYAAEALVRVGIGTIEIVDAEKIEESNLNRQLLATLDTVGQFKTAAAKMRFEKIDPSVKIVERRVFYDQNTAEEFDFADFDYVIDAIDTVSSKILLIQTCINAGVKIVSCMGTGNKFHPELLQITDLAETHDCPLSKVMRRELSKRGIKHLKVVYSPETPQKSVISANGRHAPASISYVPPVAGFLLASAVVNDMLGK